MAEKTEFVLGANFGTPYGSGSQLIFSAPILYRHAPQQTEKLRCEIQNPQIVQQTISLNAKRSTLLLLLSFRLLGC
jgi:hypothetical protein